MLVTSFSRGQLLSVLPQGGCVAEVGVLKGNFSAKILSVVQPSALHLIDLWARDDDDEYLNNMGGRPTKRLSAEVEADRRLNMHRAYDLVQERFRDEIASGRVKLHRGDSLDVAATLPDQTLDWVYIDAMHDYENVLIDLVAYKDKVKPAGFILGHDFSNNPKSRKQGFGVVAAVREFVATEGWHLVLITNETAPSYLLARNDNDTTLPALRTALVSAPGCALIEIDDRILGRYEQVAVTRADGRQGYVMRFS